MTQTRVTRLIDARALACCGMHDVTLPWKPITGVLAQDWDVAPAAPRALLRGHSLKKQRSVTRLFARI